MKKELLIPYKEYTRLEHAVPYVYHLTNKTQHLFYFGCNHSTDINDPQFKSIDEQWDEFIRLTGGKNCVVLVEGGLRPVLLTKEVAIKTVGEMAYVTFLAANHNIETQSPEPKASDRYAKLLTQFSKEEIAYYDFALVCYQWNRQTTKPPFESYVENFLQADARSSGWGDFEFTLKHMLEIHTSLFNTPFEKNDIAFFRSILDPLDEKSRINTVSLYEESGLRDEYILGEIERLWNMGKNIFVIYGVSHAVRQEPVIRDIVVRTEK